jgi:hypothetical protein
LRPPSTTTAHCGWPVRRSVVAARTVVASAARR